MITVHQLSKTYETAGEAIQVLDRLDLTLAAGETAAIVGPSGSGKSTLLNLLGALDRPTSGSITIGDQNISTFSEEQAAAFRNHSLGFIFQQQHLLPQLNVLENVLVPRLAGDWQESAAETEKRALTLLESVGLSNRPSWPTRQRRWVAACILSA
jgi:lipoprotein-releasing system ATP-binding protein